MLLHDQAMFHHVANVTGIGVVWAAQRNIPDLANGTPAMPAVASRTLLPTHVVTNDEADWLALRQTALGVSVPHTCSLLSTTALTVAEGGAKLWKHGDLPFLCHASGGSCHAGAFIWSLQYSRSR